MFKKLSAFIFAAIAFLSFSSVAFANSYQVVGTNDDVTFTTNLSASGTCQVYNNGIGTYVSFPGGVYGNVSCSSDGKSVTFNSALPDNTYILHTVMSGTEYDSIPFTISGGVCTAGCSAFHVTSTADDVTFSTNLSASGTCAVFNGNTGSYVSFPGGIYGNVSCSSDGTSITFNSALPDNTYILHTVMSGTEYTSVPFTISGGSLCTSGCSTSPSTNPIQVLSTPNDITFATNLSASGTCQVYNNGIGTYVSFPGGVYGNVSCSSDGKSVTFNSALPDNTYILHTVMSGTEYDSIPFTISGGVCTSGCSTNSFQVVGTNDDVTFTTNLSASGTCQVYDNGIGSYVSFPGGLYGYRSCSSDGKSVTFNSTLPDNTYILHTVMSGTEYDSIPFTISGGVCTSGCPTNNPPSLQPLSNASINEGATYSATGSFTDPDSTSWTATVNYGDGGDQPLTLNPDKTFSLSHLYKDNQTNNAPYTVTVKITDNQGATGTGTAQVTVNNVAPTPGAVTISPNPVQINTVVTATANFTDPGVLDTHTATINWGDGTGTHPCTVTESNGLGSVSCSLSSGYSSANVYPVTITVTDANASDGNASGTSPTAYASVYNPTQSSIFTAGQRFSNPSTASPSTAGNVTFGLSYKYQGGMPSGVRAFSMDFNAANLHFNATNVNSLVVSNGFATLIGTGTINGGSSTDNFLVTGVNGGGIRIQITDNSNNVIYDTQPGDPITATPTTSVSGQVIVH